MAPMTGSQILYKIDEYRVRPMVVTQVFPDEYGPGTYGVNGTVFLDGSNDLSLNPLPTNMKPVATGVPLLSVYSARQGDGPGEWNWPPKE